MKKFFVVLLLCFNIAAVIAIVGRSNANIAPAEKITGRNVFIGASPKPFIPSSEKIREMLRKYGLSIKQTSHENGFTPQTIAATIYVESGGNPKAKGSKGEIGCMQVMPATAKFIEEKFGFRGDLENCSYNMRVGTKYLAYLHDTHKFEYAYQTLAAYNIGPGNVMEYPQKKLPEESMKYLQKIQDTIERMPKHW